MPSETLRSLVRKYLPSTNKVEQRSVSQKTASFWTLPPEIRNIIFEQAYGDDQVRKVKSSRLAKADQKGSKVTEHVPIYASSVLISLTVRNGASHGVKTMVHRNSHHLRALRHVRMLLIPRYGTCGGPSTKTHFASHLLE